MSVQNTRRLMTETYDPKQRIIGGIVLFLIVLFIYSILKLLLGFSSGEKFVMVGEELEPQVTETPAAGSSGEVNTNHSGSGRSMNPVIRLPKNFVFLNINGEPLQKESWQPVNSKKETAAKSDSSDEDKNWYVQAASFKDEKLANQLAQKIKDKNIAPEAIVVKSGNGWYSVRLPPQADRDSAEKQRKQLNSQLRLKSEVKKVD